MTAILRHQADPRDALADLAVKELVMRRAASLLFQPAQRATSAAASVRSDFDGCFRALIGLCIYINCRCMERSNAMARTTE